MPRRHLLAEFEFATQRSKFFAHEFDDLTAAHHFVVAYFLLSFARFRFGCRLGGNFRFHRFCFGIDLDDRFGHLGGLAFARLALIVFKGLTQEHIKFAGRLFIRGIGKFCFEKRFCFFCSERWKIDCHDELGQAIDLAAGYHQHVRAVLRDRLFIGGSCIAGEDSFEFHKLLTLSWSMV